MEKSNLDVAFEIMQGRAEAITFSELWEQICVVQGYSETEKNNRIGKFYTNLFMDGRFITLGDNTWDLRDRYTFDKVHIDMNDVYHDDDEDEIINDDDDDEDKIIGDDGEDDDEDYDESLDK